MIFLILSYGRNHCEMEDAPASIGKEEKILQLDCRMATSVGREKRFMYINKTFVEHIIYF